MLIVFLRLLFVLLLVAAIGIVLKLSIKRKVKQPPKPVELVGRRATVSESIILDGHGEIQLIMNKKPNSVVAKSTNGGTIRAGKEVVICWIENQIAYVVSIDDVKD